MVKVKHWDNADLVVGGCLGSLEEPRCLLVGAYDDAGILRFMGQTTALTGQHRREAAARLKELGAVRSFGGWPTPGRSRWESQRFESWTPLVPDLVCEVAYTRLDAGTGTFRHGCRFVRWRPDKDPSECRLDGRPGLSGRYRP